MNSDAMKVARKLKELGISANLRGYPYLRYIITESLQDPNVGRSKLGPLYDKIAQRFQVSRSAVERAVYHAILTGWPRADRELAVEMFGPWAVSFDCKPTVMEFIATVADYVVMDRED